MTERIYNVKVIEVEYVCHCGEPMFSLGTQLTMNPPLYPHQCVNGHNKTLRSIYPFIRHERIVA